MCWRTVLADKCRRENIGPLAKFRISDLLYRTVFEPLSKKLTRETFPDYTEYIEFIDSGIAFNPLERSEPDLTLSADEREIGGL
ncbi:MAG: hypothetical protein IKT20_04195, partial [Clostridiales bacterium]|nr:hypothetical protein [Clostridiales bacterium]